METASVQKPGDRYTEINSCRSCQSQFMVPVLSLGKMPLANSLLPDSRTEEKIYPLDVLFCRDCALMQLKQTVSPSLLFDEYCYFSSYSDTAVAEANKLAQKMVQERELGKSSLVIEIASNDGYLLQHYVNRNIKVLGIEPAANVADVAESRGIGTLREYFNQRLALRVVREFGPADVIHANNVLAHVPDFNDFLAGIKDLLKEDGVAVIEFPYLKDMLDRTEFDTIYHEHVFYFSLTALAKAVARHGLFLTDVERLSIHGGSLRVYISLSPSPKDQRVRALLSEEERWGALAPGSYEGFGEAVRLLRTELKELLAGLKSDGKSIAAYGASAKGTVLLNYCDIGRETLDFIVDRSPHKQGKWAPGSRLPIYDTGKLNEAKPDYVLLLSWNFQDEILSQQWQYLKLGGHFIVPLPKAKILL